MRAHLDTPRRSAQDHQAPGKEQKERPNVGKRTKQLPLPRSNVFWRRVLADPFEIHGLMHDEGVLEALQRLRDDGLLPWEAAAVVLAATPGLGNTEELACQAAEVVLEQFDGETEDLLRRKWLDLKNGAGL